MITVNRSLKKIIGIVVAAHFAIVVSGLIQRPTHHHLKPVKKIIVQQVHLNPVTKKAETKAQTVGKARQKQTPIAKAAPQKKKEEPKNVVEDTKKQQLLAVAREKMANVQKSKKNVPQVKSAGLPESVNRLKVDQLSVDIGNAAEVTYHDILAEFLKERLVLPDIGDVKITLTLSRAGQVIEFKIINAQNEKNRLYIQDNLPKLHFPPFDRHLKGEKVYTFIMTLVN